KAALGNVILNGNASLFAGGSDAFRWTLAVPSGSNARLQNDRQAVTTFFADVPGIYKAQLVVNDGIANTPASPPSEVIIEVDAALRRVSFSRDIVPIFNTCAGCHKGFDNPRFDTPCVLFDNVIEYVDFNIFDNSSIVSKPSGNSLEGCTEHSINTLHNPGYSPIF